MAYVDEVFKSMCKDIIENGTDTKGELVRPVWPDTGEKAYTIKKFGVVNRYDLRKEFPALTLRKTMIRSAVDELLWIWQKKSNNVNVLNSHIWDEWADATGSIGKAYGYQIGKRYFHHKDKVTDDYTLKNFEKQYKDYPSFQYKIITTDKTDLHISGFKIYLDQIDAVIYDLKHNPYSRRIITNIYNLEELGEMNLYPCAYSMTFNCTKDPDSDKIILNGILNQRSQDVLTANNWNVVQYAVLLHMIAQVCDMVAGELVHVIADCHIYDRHVPLVKELISREPYPAPKLWIDPTITNFYDFTPDSVKLIDYKTGEQIRNIPVAV